MLSTQTARGRVKLPDKQFKFSVWDCIVQCDNTVSREIYDGIRDQVDLCIVMSTIEIIDDQVNVHLDNEIMDTWYMKE